MNAHVGSTALASPAPKARCRAIALEDIPAVTDLLVEGFPRRSRRFWARGLSRMTQRHVPDGSPRFGFLIEADGEIVGCLLLIVSEPEGEGGTTRRANVSSWYVRPAFRFQAAMLVSVVLREKNLTLVNISPAPHTVPILIAQGYRQYVAGQAVMVPALSQHGTKWRVRRVGAASSALAALVAEGDLLMRHAAAGCIALICSNGDRHEPFVFARRRIIRTIVPAAQLVWCRDVSSFQTLAGAIGRHLLTAGIAAVCCDANGPMPDLPGVYREGSARKFFRGVDQPRLGDLADTELVIFGA